MNLYILKMKTADYLMNKSYMYSIKKLEITK